MAIIMRNGLAANFDPNKMRAGELAIVTDARELHATFAPGDSPKVLLDGEAVPNPETAGTEGQVLALDENGDPEWKSVAAPSDAQVEAAVTDWLDEHPEATTTVEDGAITYAKLDSNLKGTVDDVGELKSDFHACEFADQTVEPIKNWLGKSNNAITNNNDGTFTLGTSDYGTVLFRHFLLEPGCYQLYGVPNGVSFLSSTVSYTSAFVTNSSADEKTITIQEETDCYLGFRIDTYPSASFVIRPYLKKTITASAWELKNEFDKTVVISRNAQFEFCQGGFNRGGSQLSSTYAAFYLISGDYIQPNVIKANAADGYKLTCMAWNKSNLSFAGFMDDENRFTTTTGNAVYYAQSIDFNMLQKMYPDYLFRLEVANTLTTSGTNTQIMPSEANAVTFEELTLPCLLRDYYKAEMDKTVEEVQASIDEPALVFPLMTDEHFASESNLSTLFNVGAENIEHFCGIIPVDLVANLGDQTDGDRDRYDVTIPRNLYALRKMARTREDYLYAIGNHDTNYYAPGQGTSFSGSEYFPSYLANTRGVVFDEMSEYPLNYYKDYQGLALRVVVLDANYLGRYAYSSAAATWLSEIALNTDFTVVLLEHLSSIPTQNWEGRSLTNGSDVTSALTAFVNNGGKLIQICGHAHADYYFASPWLAITHGCQKLESVDTNTSGFQAITGYVGDIVSPSRVRRTATEDLWSVFVVKPVSGTVAQIRFGAGINRYWHYKPKEIATTESVTSMLQGTLTWTTNDNTVATVSNGIITAVSAGKCQITATDAEGNFETWAVSVA